MRGDTGAVQTLLRQKADVNAPQIDGTTALHWAVEANDLELADLLLRAGAKPSAANGRRDAAAAGDAKRKCRDDRAAADGRRGSERSADENGRHRAR